MNSDFNPKFTGYIELSNHIWFFERAFNALVCMDKSDGRIKRMIRIPAMDISEQYLYSSVFKIGNELIGIPNRSDKIVTYNLANDRFFLISLKEYIKTSSISNYGTAYQYGNEIIMLPNRADKIVVYNSLEQRVSTIEIKDKLLDNLYPNRAMQFRRQFEILDGYMFIPFVETGAILQFNLSTKQAEVRFVEGLSGCATINYYNGMFYLASWNEKKIYAVDMDFHIVDTYVEYPSALKADKHIFAYSLLMDEKILYFPQAGNMIISLSLQDKAIKEEMRFQAKCSDYIKTYIAGMAEKEVISLTVEDPWLVAFFYSDGILCRRLYCTWDATYNNKMIKCYLKSNHYFHNSFEKSGIGLSALIEMQKHTTNNGLFREDSKQVETVGKKIYKYVSEESKHMKG